MRAEVQGQEPYNESYDVLGTPISSIRLPDVLRFVDDTVEAGRSEYVCVCSTNNVMSAWDDEDLARIHQDAAMCVPDGYYLAKIGQRRRPGKVERIRGTDLTWRLAEHAADRGYSIFLYGAAHGVPQQMAASLQKRAPGLKIAGTHSPPFRPTTSEEDQAEIQMINDVEPDILFVGLPTPKQDRWMADHVDKVNVNVMFGVGAAFDFIAGTKEQAPRWISDNGFEWAYRFAQEPTRLWRRVLVQGPRFASLVALDTVKRRLGGDRDGARGSP